MGRRSVVAFAVAETDADLEMVGCRLADWEDTTLGLEIPNCVEY